MCLFKFKLIEIKKKNVVPPSHQAQATAQPSLAAQAPQGQPRGTQHHPALFSTVLLSGLRGPSDHPRSQSCEGTGGRADSTRHGQCSPHGS